MVSRSSIFRQGQKLPSKQNPKSDNEKPAKKRVGDRPFTNNRDKGEER